MPITSNLPTGFVEYFGGAEKMQATFRAKLEELKATLKRAKTTHRARKGRYKKTVENGLQLVNEILAEEIIDSYMISQVVASLSDFYLKDENFYKVEVPEGKTPEQVWEEILSRPEYEKQVKETIMMNAGFEMKRLLEYKKRK